MVHGPDRPPSYPTRQYIEVLRCPKCGDSKRIKIRTREPDSELCYYTCLACQSNFKDRRDVPRLAP